jgi:hypothetical protein
VNGDGRGGDGGSDDGMRQLHSALEVRVPDPRMDPVAVLMFAHASTH